MTRAEKRNVLRWQIGNSIVRLNAFVDWAVHEQKRTRSREKVLRWRSVIAGAYLTRDGLSRVLDAMDDEDGGAF